jgi:excisionase family DNA binding protein
VNVEDRFREIAREEFERLFAERDRENAKKRWMTIAETAVYLGTTPAAVRRRIERGRIPIRHQGRCVLVDRVELDRRIGQ